MLTRADLGKARSGPSGLKGFTLVELMVTLALLAILMMLAAPSFTEMIRNTQVRSVADALQTGLRAAQAEAVRRNRQVVFTLTNETPGATSTAVANGRNWAIHTVSRTTETGRPAEFMQGGKFTSTAEGVSVSGPSSVCFNAMGRLVANSATGVTGAECTLGTTLPSFNVSVAGASRALRVTLALGGQVRMCDPNRTQSSSQPDGCPATP